MIVNFTRLTRFSFQQYKSPHRIPMKIEQETLTVHPFAIDFRLTHLSLLCGFSSQNTEKRSSLSSRSRLDVETREAGDRVRYQP